MHGVGGVGTSGQETPQRGIFVVPPESKRAPNVEKKTHVPHKKDARKNQIDARKNQKKRRDVPTVGIEPASSRITVKSLSRPPHSRITVKSLSRPTHQSSHLILRARLALECRIYDDRGSCFAKKWVLARRIAATLQLQLAQSAAGEHCHWHWQSVRERSGIAWLRRVHASKLWMAGQ